MRVGLGRGVWAEDGGTIADERLERWHGAGDDSYTTLNY